MTRVLKLAHLDLFTAKIFRAYSAPQTSSCYELTSYPKGTPLVSLASLAFEAPHNLKWLRSRKH